MSQSLVQVYTHLVFSTKQRKPYLQENSLREKLHAYLAGACNNLTSPSLIVGGVEEHVHVLFRLGKTISIADFVREVKRESSKWIKRESSRLSMFQWQNGYGAFSISPSHLEDLKQYIANQAENHKTETFQDEFRRLCRKYDLEIDERYVWD
jgi:REP element-mobilizing transposase RayT